MHVGAALEGSSRSVVHRSTESVPESSVAHRSHHGDGHDVDRETSPESAVRTDRQLPEPRRTNGTLLGHLEQHKDGGREEK